VRKKKKHWICVRSVNASSRKSSDLPRSTSTDRWQWHRHGLLAVCLTYDPNADSNGQTTVTLHGNERVGPKHQHDHDQYTATI